MIDHIYEVTCMVKTSKSKNGVWHEQPQEKCFFKDEKQADLWVAAKVREYEKRKDGFRYLFRVNKCKLMDDTPKFVEKILT